ncbi:MAG: MaoC/PaaZ C-terminal domain-containing protein [Gammaproteobacteria bacterium]|jgi:acyl dehydratase|nr:MaoC/PaaZ C-terminal domain-containing protein [Gammaproteobacteria bacterium]
MRFAQFKVGDVIAAGMRRIEEVHILEFARDFDPQPFHVDTVVAGRSRWGGIIASGWHTCSLAMALVVEHVLTGSESFGSPGVDDLRWEAPVRPGDELSLTLTVLSTRVSSSGAIGIVRWRWKLHNQDRVRVLSLVATSLFALGESKSMPAGSRSV